MQESMVLSWFIVWPPPAVAGVRGGKLEVGNEWSPGGASRNAFKRVGAYPVESMMSTVTRLFALRRFTVRVSNPARGSRGYRLIMPAPNRPMRAPSKSTTHRGCQRPLKMHRVSSAHCHNRIVSRACQQKVTVGNLSFKWTTNKIHDGKVQSRASALRLTSRTSRMSRRASHQRRDARDGLVDGSGSDSPVLTDSTLHGHIIANAFTEAA